MFTMQKPTTTHNSFRGFYDATEYENTTRYVFSVDGLKLCNDGEATLDELDDAASAIAVSINKYLKADCVTYDLICKNKVLVLDVTGDYEWEQVVCAFDKFTF